MLTQADQWIVYGSINLTIVLWGPHTNLQVPPKDWSKIPTLVFLAQAIQHWPPANLYALCQSNWESFLGQSHTKLVLTIWLGHPATHSIPDMGYYKSVLWLWLSLIATNKPCYVKSVCFLSDTGCVSKIMVQQIWVQHGWQKVSKEKKKYLFLKKWKFTFFCQLLIDHGTEQIRQ